MQTRSKLVSLGAAAALASAVGLAACGGGSTTLQNTNFNSTNPAVTSPTVLSAGDAPMNNVLAAFVTISAATANTASGSVSLLPKATTIELTHLGGVQAPLSETSLPQGTYTGISLTITGVSVTYMNGTTVTTASTSAGTAVIDNAGTTTSAGKTGASVTEAFAAPLVVADGGATDFGLDFDLQSDLDLTAGVVTYTPNTILVSDARQAAQKGAQLNYEVEGSVGSVNSSTNSLLVTTDTGANLNVVVGATALDDGLGVANLQAGTYIHSTAALNSDGSFTASAISDLQGGAATSKALTSDGGIVTAATFSGTTLTSVSFVVRDSSTAADLGTTITDPVTSATSIKGTALSTAAGVSSWGAAQVFPGAAIWVSTTPAVTGTTPAPALANEIRPEPVNPFGAPATAATTTSGVTTFTMANDPQTDRAAFAGIVSPTVSVNSATVVNLVDSSTTDATAGKSIPASAITAGDPAALVARGYITSSGGTTPTYTLYATVLNSEIASGAGAHPNN